MTTVSSTTSSNTILADYLAKQNATDTSSTSTSTSISSVTGDFNTFLKILTTQLQCQDPMSATDPNEFTQELVQFSGVEQQINTNSKLDSILASLSSNGITPLLNYVGKTVEAAADNKIVVQNSTANFSYSLPSAAKSVTITVTDSSGSTVAKMDGATATGVNRVSWDGTRSDGDTASDGTYTVKIAATDSDGKSLTVSDIKLIGQVTGIQTASDGTTTLQVGNVSLETADVTSVFSGVTATSQST